MADKDEVLSRRMKAAEFKAKGLEAVEEVARTGESITVTKRGKPVAQLVPMTRRTTRQPTTLRAVLKGLMKSHGDIATDAVLVTADESLLDWSGPLRMVAARN